MKDILFRCTRHQKVLKYSKGLMSPFFEFFKYLNKKCLLNVYLCGYYNSIGVFELLFSYCYQLLNAPIELFDRKCLCGQNMVNRVEKFVLHR